MKKILLICIVSISAITTQTHAQFKDTSLSPNSQPYDPNFLFQKAKKQKTAAWILLGGGTGMAVAGLAIMVKDGSEEASAALVTVFTLGLVTPEEPKSSAAGPILAIAGTGAMLGSIPLFMASAKNKRKASLMLKDESLFFNPRQNLKEHLIAVGLKINL
jgi:hypothetical protein